MKDEILFLTFIVLVGLHSPCSSISVFDDFLFAAQFSADNVLFLSRYFPILFVTILESDSNYNTDMVQKSTPYLLLQILLNSVYSMIVGVDTKKISAVQMYKCWVKLDLLHLPNLLVRHHLSHQEEILTGIDRRPTLLFAPVITTISTWKLLTLNSIPWISWSWVFYFTF